MLSPNETLAEIAHQLAPRSLWHERLRRRASPRPIEDWLVEEANVRGFMGASGLELPTRNPDPSLTDEDLVVALLSPHSRADGRIFKLVVRMAQSGALSADRLIFRARRERALGALYWLLRLTPESERNPALLAVLERIGGPPRDYHPLDYDYDPSRLLRRPASKGALWRAPQR